MTRSPYTYSLLRYYHDITSGEFVCVGVAVHSAMERAVRFKLRPSLGRFGDLLDDDRAANFRTMLKYIQARTKAVADESTGLNLKARYGSLEDALREVFPRDDSALQWSEPKSGLSSDIERTVERLYDRYCAKYDRKQQHAGKSDTDAWRSFKLKLADRNMLEFFDEKKIEGKSDEVSFPFAWKNGVWHCIEPISLDLAKAEQLRAKVHKCAGEIVGIRDAEEDFAVYFIVSRPQRSALDEAFEKALGVLKNIPHRVEVYEEGNESPLLDRLTEQIAQHPLH